MESSAGAAEPQSHALPILASIPYPMSDRAALLSMHGITKCFGATNALVDVSLAVRRGEVLALIGENGAGKSTLMKVLSGAHRPDAGQMYLDGQLYAPSGPHQARRAGVAMIYQELNLAPDLSVEDNIMLGQEEHRAGLLRRGRQRERVAQALDMLGHAELRPQTPIDRLSVGAATGRDRPRPGLTAQDHRLRRADQLAVGPRRRAFIPGDREAARRRAGHHLHQPLPGRDSPRRRPLRSAARWANRRLGALSGASEAEIVSLMVGRNVRDLFPTLPHEAGVEILSLEGLSGVRTPRDVSLSVRRGEILGIAGLVGAGRTELLRCILGLDSVRSGQVRVAGRLSQANPRARIRAGLGLVSEDRKGEGLAQERSIADNLTLSRLAPYSRLGWLSLRRRDAAVRDWMRRLEVKAASPEQPISELSGGNQQKVALARLLHQDADVLLLDEPTRGIDVGTKAAIYRRIGELAAQGRAIIFVSSYLPELLAVCDRVGVMSRGRLREIRPTSAWSEEAVMACAIGGTDLG